MELNLQIKMIDSKTQVKHRKSLLRNYNHIIKEKKTPEIDILMIFFLNYWPHLMLLMQFHLNSKI
jgi:hypothetical protein